MRLLVVLLVVILGGVLMPMKAAAQVKSSPSTAKQEKKGEAFAGGVLIDAMGSSFRDPVRLERLIDEVKKSPFHHVFLQVRAYGDAYYNSQIVPRAYGVTERVSETEAFDPLAIFLRAMKTADPPRMVHAWVIPFRVANANRGVPEAAGHVVKAHADWLSRNSGFETEDADGNRYLEPGLEDVQAHLEAVVDELVRGYPLDGIALDGLCYPGANWGYHTAMLDAWRKQTGSQDPPAADDQVWGQMRREIIDKNLQRMARAAHQARPGVQVWVLAKATGAAPMSPEEFAFSEPYRNSMQNWAGWMKKEKKDADRIILENFRSEGEGMAAFDQWNVFAGLMVKETGVEILAGIAGFQNISLDAMAQMRRTLESGLAGAVISNFQKPIQDNASKELFFRALSGTVLAADSMRRAFPESGEIAANSLTQAAETAATPKESKPEEVKEDIPPPPQPIPVEPTEPKAETELVQPDDLDDPGKYTNLVKPTDDAMDTLKRMYANIF